MRRYRRSLGYIVSARRDEVEVGTEVLGGIVLYSSHFQIIHLWPMASPLPAGLPCISLYVPSQDGVTTGGNASPRSTRDRPLPGVIDEACLAISDVGDLGFVTRLLSALLWERIAPWFFFFDCTGDLIRASPVLDGSTFRPAR